MASNGNEELGKQLLSIKANLEEKREKYAELQGELKSHIERLQDFNISTKEEATDKVNTWKKEIKKMEKEIEEKIKLLKEMVEND